MAMLHDENAKREFIQESVRQCIDYQQRARDPPSRGGQKDYKPDGSWLEGKKLQSFHKERLQVLSEQRVRVKNVLSTAEWDAEKGKARVTHKMGKWWQRMGHHEDQAEWLLPEEATYLMDEGLLLVYDEGLPLSMEDAYAVMLAGHVPLHNYTVYAHLTRQGYILVRFTQPPEVTDYEKKLGLENVIKKQSKKRKMKNNNDEPDAKQFCGDGNNVLPEAVGDTEQNMDSTEQPNKHSELGDKHAEQVESENNHREQIQSKNSSKLAELETSPDCSRKKRYIVDCKSQKQIHYEHETSEVPYSSWNWDQMSLPHILPSIHRTVKLPSPRPELLPPSVSCSASEFSPQFLGPRAPMLEFSFGTEETRKGRTARNWGEYKRQSIEEKDLLLESPASRYWSEEVKPLVHPSDSVSTGDILAKFRMIDSISPRDYCTRDLVQDSQYRIAYDMYKPDKNFTKTAPKKPVVRLCIVKDDSGVPDLSVINSLHQQCSDGVPIKFAVVEAGAVSFVSFDVVDIPVQITPLESCKF